jgi:hypothetical protein
MQQISQSEVYNVMTNDGASKEPFRANKNSSFMQG